MMIATWMKINNWIAHPSFDHALTFHWTWIMKLLMFQDSFLNFIKVLLFLSTLGAYLRQRPVDTSTRVLFVPCPKVLSLTSEISKRPHVDLQVLWLKIFFIKVCFSRNLGAFGWSYVNSNPLHDKWPFSFWSLQICFESCRTGHLFKKLFMIFL